MSDYSVWVCEYAVAPYFHKSAIVYGAHNQGTIKLPFSYVLIKGRDHVAMIDVGYNYKNYGKTLGERFGVENWHSPQHVLAKCGVKPEDVDTVFATHCHFDHFGNTEDFPNATFYVQEREIAKWVWVMSLPPRMRWLMTALDPEDIVKTVQLARDERLVTVSGAMENALPGIDLHPAFDTHTYGSMYVNIRNDGKPDSSDNWVIAGDNVYSYDNIVGEADAVGLDNVYVPVGLGAGSQTNMILILEEMMKLAGYERRRVIAVHEERLKDEFPSRVGDDGLRVTEICLGDGQQSCVGA